MTDKKDCPLILTEAALSKLKAALIEDCNYLNGFIRVGVKGGGCSGFLYNLEIIDKNQIDSEEDEIFELEDLSLVIDIFSKEYLKGTTLDYFTSLKESGFKFTNPSVKRTCGCGSSFSV